MRILTLPVFFAACWLCVPSSYAAESDATKKLKSGYLDLTVEKCGDPPIQGNNGSSNPPQLEGAFLGGALAVEAGTDLYARYLYPLVENSIQSFGTYLQKVSGSSNLERSINGTLPTYFYRTESSSGGGLGFSETTNTLSNLCALKISHVNGSGSSTPFEVRLRFVYSDDGKAFRLVPTYINYPSGVTSRRAKAAELTVDIGSPLSGFSSVQQNVPIGKSPCGRPGSGQCNSKLNADIKDDNSRISDSLSSLGGEWTALPPLPKELTNVQFFNADPGQQGKRLSPVNIGVTLKEHLSYNWLLDKIGGFLSNGNNSKVITQDLVNALELKSAETRAQERNEMRTTRENAVINREFNLKSYFIMKQLYDEKLSNAIDPVAPAACQTLLNEWRKISLEAIKLGINESKPREPDCTRR